MTARTAKKKPLGTVAFVGAGPGDPGLLTARAADLLTSAEVVVVDQGSTAQRLAERTCADVELIDATFAENGQPLSHAARARLLVRAAKAGQRVVRLLDGDGVTFSGIAEEMVACRKAGVPFEVVPGVSPSVAVPVYAGVPLGTRGTSTVHVVDATGRIVADSLTSSADTLVLLGGPDDMVVASEVLVDAGRGADEQIVITAAGTTTEQRTVVTTLGSVSATLRSAGTVLTGSLVGVVGPGVEVRENASWFETKPLFGWRVLVPRTQQQSGPTVERLAAYGAVSEVVPTISVEPPRTPHQMEKAVKGLVTGRYEWIGFTSVNAVRAVREKFVEFGLDARAFSGLKVAAVGGATAQALREWGIEPDLVPSGEQSAQGLLAEWPPYDEVLDPINRVFLPRADIATDTLVAGLQAGGWEVDDVTAYRTVRAAPPPAPVRDAIKTGAFDAVVFTSSSTVRNLVGIAGKPHPSTVVACIGPATAKTAEEHGLRVDVLAPEASSAALVDALAEYGTGLRASALEAGEPVLRPSERRPSARRKAR
ncbi:bifunctional uroporphyrinogen-III C-methyltransferase/uroporphyrinogen-III synthase [Kineosporiaceae bacterium SCSIO 59966]|nr:bifunctional uroporphyrinogen-III C-methyltransferase/uroporphyrinogen-III synthase [Kineosporiaceae bacterium SCSIO 59966]